MELFQEIRREYEFGSGTVRAVARNSVFIVAQCDKRFKVGAATGADLYSSAAPRLDPVKPFIDSILKADLQAPCKQRHTAQRIYNRLREELPQHAVGRSTVAEYILKCKEELGICHRETFMPQSCQWGVEGQVDWYEAFVDLTGERTKVYVFCLRSMATGAAFYSAYLRPIAQNPD